MAESLTWWIKELVKCREENSILAKRIDDWRGMCEVEMTVGMEWKVRALKAEAELEYQVEKLKVELEKSRAFQYMCRR